MARPLLFPLPMEGIRSASIESAQAVERPRREVTMVFCDIAGFTQFTERLGDDLSYWLVRRCELLVVSSLREHGGELLEVRGDGFLFAFASPEDAAACAVAIQRAVERAEDLPLHVRVGLHTGTAIHDGIRYFGRTVIAAFRVSSLAGAEEILVSDETRRRLPTTDFPVDGARRVRLKGLEGHHRIWKLDWRAARRAHRSLHLGASGALRASGAAEARLAAAQSS